MRRAFEMRENVTAHDACSVALAEALDCHCARGTGVQPKPADLDASWF